MIEKTITIEELIAGYPQSAGFLLNRGFHGLACGEPVQGTLQSCLHNQGYNDTEIELMVKNLNEYIEKA